MKKGNIIWNSTDYGSLGVYVSGKEVHDAAEPDVTVYQIAGRNGDFVVSNNRWKNIKISYPAFIPNSLANLQTIRNALKRYGFYSRLDDTYDTTHYRIARPVGELRFEPFRQDAVNFEITFDCYPQRFLTIGTTEVTLGSSTVVTNPTDFDAKPYIRLTNIAASAEIDFNGDFVMTATTSYSDTVVIDCENQNIFDEATLENKNNLFEVSDGFPVLWGADTNTITITGTIGSASLEPRWWEL